MPNKSPSTPRGGSLRSASHDLRCSAPKTRELIRAGLLRAYKIGNNWKITDEAIAECREKLTEIAMGGQK